MANSSCRRWRLLIVAHHDRLIAQLGAEEWSRREAAGRALLAQAERGPLELARRLAAACDHTDLELRSRAAGLLERFRADGWLLRARAQQSRGAVGEALRLGLAAGLASRKLAADGAFRHWLAACHRQVVARGARVARGERELFLVQDYGEGPHEVYEDGKSAARRVAELLKNGQKTEPPQQAAVGTLRDLKGLSQEMVAKALKVGQATVSKLERQSDMKISTLRRMVKAMGGELEIRVRMGKEVVELTQFTSERRGKSDKR